MATVVGKPPKATSHRPSSSSRGRIKPDEVQQRLAEHILVDGFDLVVDLDRSQGSWLVDACSGVKYLDLYSFHASAPLGINPSEIIDDSEFMAELARVAANKPANSAIYTAHYAEFVETFYRVLGDAELPYLFFIEGGALAVENALKVAFDWKSHRNEAAGRSRKLGTKVLHLTRAFHGRSGYTLSLTNTDPVKTERFPQFDWPRIDVPTVRFPLSDNLAEVKAYERYALDQAVRAFTENPHDIACFIAEPIQGEGGDNHMRPEFLREMQQLCTEYDALFILDEVQTGCGVTGTPWAYQQLGLEPDIVAFSKRTQLGGIMAGRRVADLTENALRVSSRINSTWGGGLVDMVRFTRIMQIIEKNDVFSAVKRLGEVFLERLHQATQRYPVLSNVRGRGLMCAVDLPNAATRDEVLKSLIDDEHVLLLACGPRSIRFRPALTITEAELGLGADALERSVARLS